MGQIGVQFEFNVIPLYTKNGSERIRFVSLYPKKYFMIIYIHYTYYVAIKIIYFTFSITVG